jgi:hypothetical protein
MTTLCAGSTPSSTGGSAPYTRCVSEVRPSETDKTKNNLEVRPSETDKTKNNRKVRMRTRPRITQWPHLRNTSPCLRCGWQGSSSSSGCRAGATTLQVDMRHPGGELQQLRCSRGFLWRWERRRRCNRSCGGSGRSGCTFGCSTIGCFTQILIIAGIDDNGGADQRGVDAVDTVKHSRGRGAGEQCIGDLDRRVLQRMSDLACREKPCETVRKPMKTVRNREKP